MRRAALRLASITGDRPEFYLRMPVRDFVEFNNEVAALWSENRSRI